MTPRCSHQRFRPAEGNPARRADQLVDLLQIDLRFLADRHRKKLSFLSFRNRFLVCPPGISPRSACESATVNSGGCETVVTSMPSSRERRKARRASWAWLVRRWLSARPRLGQSSAAKQARRRWLAQIAGPNRQVRAAQADARRGFPCCIRPALRPYRRGLRLRRRASGCSSGVEHNLAKVGVGRSNRFTRSNFL